MAQAARKIENTPNALTPTPDQFAVLRDTIDRLEKQAGPSSDWPGAQRGGGGNTARRGSPSRSRKGQSMSDTAQAPANPNAKPNALTMAEMLIIADDLGKQDAQGKDVQVKMDLKVAEAAFVGALDLTKDKHGDGVDDAAKLAEAYFKARNATNIFDAKEGKQRKLASNLRTMVKIGSSPKFGVGEPMQTINSLMTTRQNLRRTANKGQRLDDAHNTLMRFAREQLKRDTLMAADELKSFCFKSDSDPRTADEVIRGWLSQAIKLRDGKLSNCHDVDSSQEITTIINACNRRLTAIAKAKGDAQGQAA